MLVIEFRFPSGKYHATPWDHHVNEGLVEWPPSPWRVFRALIAAWYKHGDMSTRADLYGVLDRLASERPVYRLPATGSGHTRHYMPKYNTPRDGKSDKVFDSFYTIHPADPVMMIWERTELEESRLGFLRELVSAIGYLGRSESWVTVTVSDQQTKSHPNAFPVSDHRGKDLVTRVRVPVPKPPDIYAGWRADYVRGLEMKERKNAPPENIWDSVDLDTNWLKTHRWNRPPALDWVEYSIPAPGPDLISVAESRKRRKVTTARYAIQSSVLPAVWDTLYIAERFRQALMSRSRIDDSVSPVLLGKDPSTGAVLKHSHRHAFFLPEDSDDDGFIDHLIVYNSEGFDDQAMNAVRSLRKLWGDEGHTLFLGLIAIGNAENFGGMNVARGESPALATAKCWESATPYYLARHPKVYRNGTPKRNGNGIQIDGVEDQIRKELSQIGLPDPERVVNLTMIPSARGPVHPARFASRRRRGSRRPEMPGFSVRLEFGHSVTGPIALGYGSHFGLGRFIGKISS